jgi:hypothetical protein
MAIKAEIEVQRPSREREIGALAEAVALEYFPDARFVPDPILDDSEVTISYGRYSEAFDGMLEHKNRRFHIYCNLDRVEWQDSSRARFTVAHELGHFFIDEHRNALSSGRVPAHPSKCEYESTLSVEREADHFASHLLMPTGPFRKLARSYKPGLAGVLAIADKFATSVTSAAIRYAKEETIPCVVVKWSRDGSFQWRWVSTETFRVRLRATFTDQGKLPDDCPTRRAMSGERAPKIGYFEAGTTAAAWFRFVNDHDYRNVIFMEQAIPLGRFGVLTFLYPEEQYPLFLQR